MIYFSAKIHDRTTIEIAIFRQDQLAAHKYLTGWDLQKAFNGGLEKWKTNEFLELPIHAVHCFNEKFNPSFLEILLNETDGDKWIYRRNKQITKPLAEIYLTTESGLKFLCPEIVLLYKSKRPQIKDELDFENALRKLSCESRKWFKDALAICDSEHHWLENL